MGQGLLCRLQAGTYRRIAQAGAQFPVHATIADTARLGHERKRHRRQFECDLLTTQARRARQPEGVGHGVEIFTHLQLGIIHRVVHAAAAATEQGEHREPRKIIGVNVVRMDIVFHTQHGVAAANALERQTIAGVNAGRAQDADLNAATPPEGAQLLFGIDASRCARRTWPDGTRFIDMRAATIAVNPCRAYVYEVLW